MADLDFKKFLESGGTKVYKPGEGKQFFDKAVESGRASSRGGGSRTTQAVSSIDVQAREALEREMQRQEIARRQQAQQQQQAQAQAQQQAQAAAQKQREVLSVIKTKQSGGVQVGNQTFYGEAVVPGTGGQTANQYQREIANQARRQQGIKPGKRVRFQSTETINKPTTSKPDDIPAEIKFDYDSIPTAIPNSVSAYVPTTKVYGQSWLTSIGQGFKNLIRGENPLKPFDYSGSLKRDRGSATPNFGTIQEGQGAFKTFGEIQGDVDRETLLKITPVKNEAISSINKLTSEVQQAVSDKSITLALGQQYLTEKIKPIQQEYSNKVNEIYASVVNVPGLYDRSGKEFREQAPMVLDIAGYSLAAGFGGPLGAAGYGIARGVQLAAKGAPKDTRSGIELYSGISKLSPESKQAGIYLSIGAISAVSAPGAIAREIDLLRWEEGLAEKSKTIGKHLKVNNQDWYQLNSKLKGKYLQTSTTIDVPVIRKGKETFAIGVGRGEQTVDFLSFTDEIHNEGWKRVTSEFALAGRGTVKPVIIGGEQLAPKYSATLGEAYTTLTKQVRFDTFYGKLPANVEGTGTNFLSNNKLFNYGPKFWQVKKVPLKVPGTSTDFSFGGVSEDIGEAYLGYGGRVTSKRIYGDLAGPISVTESAVDIPLRTTGIIPIKDTSIIFKKTPEYVDDFGIIVSKVGGGKSSSDFYAGLYQELQPELGSLSSGAGGTILESAKEILVTAKISPTLLFAPGQVGAVVKSVVREKPKIITLPSSGINIKSNLKPSSKSVVIISQKSNQGSVNIISSKVNQGVDNISKQKSNLGVAQKSKQKSQQKLRTKKQLRFVGLNIPVTPTIPITSPPISTPVYIPFPKFGGSSNKLSKRKAFGVQIRRGGVFGSGTRARSLKEALAIGKYKVGQGIAATFKVTGATKLPELPGYKRKGSLYIEKLGRRIKKRGVSKEVKELFEAKKSKRRSKK